MAAALGTPERLIEELRKAEALQAADIRTLSRQLDDTRRAALEEAAKVAESLHWPHGLHDWAYNEDVAAAIRDLIQTTVPSAEDMTTVPSAEDVFVAEFRESAAAMLLALNPNELKPEALAKWHALWDVCIKSQRNIGQSAQADSTTLMQARYVLRDLHAKHPDAGYGKMAQAVEQAALALSSGPYVYTPPLDPPLIDASYGRMPPAPSTAETERDVLSDALEIISALSSSVDGGEEVLSCLATRIKAVLES